MYFCIPYNIGLRKNWKKITSANSSENINIIPKILGFQEYGSFVISVIVI